MSNADIFVGELIGTAILILFGAGVCAAVTLNKSKGRGAGWVVIAFGWGFGVLAGAYTSAPLSGGQIAVLAALPRPVQPQRRRRRPHRYAINPARDLGPRITHALLPIPNKGTSEWSYSWIPVVGPIAGAVLGALIYNAAF